MDPLTALSVAGSVAQLVDFASKLISSIVDLYKGNTGGLRVDQELDLIAAEVLALTARITPSPDLSSNLQRICDETNTLAKEILGRLENLKIDGKHRIWRSLQQAITATWTREETIALMTRLTRLRDTLEGSILVSLRKEVDVISLKLSERFDSLDEQTQRIIVALLEQRSAVDEEIKHELQDQTLAVTQILNRMEVRSIDEHRRTRNELRLQSKIPNTQVVDVSMQEEDDLRESVETQILQSLFFSTMTARCEEVDIAHQKTFDWVLEDNPDDEAAWSSFTQWLSSGNGIYWINGKAGSGKSTLMRYIYYSGRTMRLLRRWAGEVPLCCATFFFWNSGTPEQKSQQGLLRALLYEILDRQRKLIPIILPWLWAKTYSMSTGMKLVPIDVYWSSKKLIRAVNLLVEQSAVPLRLCLFIDGLDEFDGDHEHISELFKTISQSSNVKVCLSSRPWRVFQSYFKGFPSLRLQDLTKSDIKRYVSDKLDNNNDFNLLEATEPQAAKELILEITEKADGVFLWVKLVVKSLLNGLRNLDTIVDLQMRLRHLPVELDKLYEYMFSLIDKVYIVKAAQIFQIVQATRTYKDHLESASEPLTLLGLSFAVTPENIESLKPRDLSKRCEEMDVHLTVHCAGLLETWNRRQTVPKFLDGNTVNYLHRTAREFIENTRTWQFIQSQTAGSNFNPNASMLKSCILRMATEDKFQEISEAYKRASNAIIFAYHADRQKDQTHIDLLDELDRTMIRLTGLDGSKPTKCHWSNEYSLGNPIPDQTSFLTFTIQCDLRSYVQSKILVRGNVKHSEGEVPLLDYVLARRSITQRTPVSTEVARVLLNANADPNRRHHGFSTWEKLLYVIYERAFAEHRHPQHMRLANLDDARSVVDMIDLFLTHGANPNASIVVSWKKKKTVSAAEVIPLLKDQGRTKYPTETKAVVQKLRSLGGKDHVSRVLSSTSVFKRAMCLPWLLNEENDHR